MSLPMREGPRAYQPDWRTPPRDSTPLSNAVPPALRTNDNHLADDVYRGVVSLIPGCKLRHIPGIRARLKIKPAELIIRPLRQW